MSGAYNTSNPEDRGYDTYETLAQTFSSLVLDKTHVITLGQVNGSGGFSEVYEAMMDSIDSSYCKKVAVKRLRVVLQSAQDFTKSLQREALIWKDLHHINVVPFLGITMIDGIPCYVSEWMENGTMPDFLRKHENINVFQLVLEIAYGLEYLHRRQVVHADLKGENVLIAHDYRPVLTDFGLSRLLVNDITIAGTTTLRGNVRWMAPELIQAPSGSPNQFHTKATDIWAFGMVVYEALSGRIPYHEATNDVQVLMAIINRTIPSRPTDPLAGKNQFDLLWKCCTDCWNFDPVGRPTISEVRAMLEGGTFDVELMLTISTEWCWVSPGGRFIATRKNGGQAIAFLDAKTMRQCGPDLREENGIYEVAWSPAENCIAIRSGDGLLQKWKNIFGTPTLVASSNQKHHGARLEYSSDDKLIGSVGGCVARLWDAMSLSLLWECAGYEYDTAFHPSGDRFFVFYGTSFHNVRIAYPGRIVTSEHILKDCVERVATHTIGGTCVCWTRAHEGIKLFSADTFEEKLKLPFNNCEALQVTPDGRYVLLVLWTQEVVLWDIEANVSVGRVRINLKFDGPWDVEISRSCRTLTFHDIRQSYVVHLTPSFY